MKNNLQVFSYTLSDENQSPLIFKGYIIEIRDNYITVYIEEIIAEGDFSIIWPGRSYNFGINYLKIREE